MTARATTSPHPELFWCAETRSHDGPRTVYLTFDVDANGSAQQASQGLAHRLQAQGIATRRVLLPNGHDPNSFFLQGGLARRFHSLLETAQP